MALSGGFFVGRRYGARVRDIGAESALDSVLTMHEKSRNIDICACLYGCALAHSPVLWNVDHNSDCDSNDSRWCLGIFTGILRMVPNPLELVMTKKRAIRLKTPDSIRPLGVNEVFVHPMNGLRRAMIDKLNSPQDNDAISEITCEDNSEKDG